jgi:hypothetical protein
MSLVKSGWATSPTVRGGRGSTGGPRCAASLTARNAQRMRPFPADLMRMWPISTRVNKPENDDPSIVEPIEPATDAA